MSSMTNNSPNKAHPSTQSFPKRAHIVFQKEHTKCQLLAGFGSSLASWLARFNAPIFEMGKVSKKGSSAQQYRQLVAAHMISHPPVASSHQSQGRVVKITDLRREEEQQRLHVAHSRLDSMPDMFTTNRGARNLVSRPRGREGGRSTERWHRGSRGGCSRWDRGSHHSSWERGYCSQSSSLRPSSSPLLAGPDTRYSDHDLHKVTSSTVNDSHDSYIKLVWMVARG